jgi:hypothetical protein
MIARPLRKPCPTRVGHRAVAKAGSSVQRGASLIDEGHQLIRGVGAGRLRDHLTVSSRRGTPPDPNLRRN